MDTIARVFTYHTPLPDQCPKYEKIRLAALEFARVIEANTVNCQDREVAIRHVRDAVYTANAAIALDGLV
jgi:hypothetical protein